MINSNHIVRTAYYITAVVFIATAIIKFITHNAIQYELLTAVVFWELADLRGKIY